jgi:hypothetical protein
MNGTWLEIVSVSESFRLREAVRPLPVGVRSPVRQVHPPMRQDVAPLATMLARLDPRATSLVPAPACR